MSSLKCYLQQRIQPCIQTLFSFVHPSTPLKSLYDLFNSQTMHRFLISMQKYFYQSLTSQIKEQLHSYQLPIHQNKQLNDQRIEDFVFIDMLITECFQLYGLDKEKIKINMIQDMVKKHHIKVLMTFLQNIFFLLVRNQDIVQFIGTLSKQMQVDIATFITKEGLNQSQFLQDGQQYFSNIKSVQQLNLQSKLRYNQVSNNQQLTNLYKLEEVEQTLQFKQQELKQIKCQKQQLEQQIEEMTKKLSHQQQQIQGYKKRLQSYQVINQLLQQKDDQIFKLTKTIAQNELKSRLSSSQFTNQTKRLHQKLSQFQSKNHELINKYQKQRNSIDQINKQKQELQSSMKIVINNLKQKNKSLSEKINDLQKQLIQVNFQKQIKEKQLQKMVKNIENSQRKYNQKDNKHDISIYSPRSPIKCQDFLDGIQMRGDYSRMGEQLNQDMEKTQFQEDLAIIGIQNAADSSNKRFSQLLHENYALKQQIQNLSTVSHNNFIDSKQYKQLQDELQKEKKKSIILKRRSDQVQNFRRQQIDIMIGVMQQCFVSQQNSIAPSLVANTSKK